jgi:ribosomal protein S27AE
MTKTPDCPSCGDGAVIPIAYGYPGPEMREQVERGEISLGGCISDDQNPAWHCDRCGLKF